MKISLGIVIHFFALAHCYLKAPDVFVDDDIGNKIDGAKFIEAINDLRFKMAKIGKIANMNELSWDDDLVTKADKLDCDNGNEDGPTFNVVGFTNKETLLKVFLAYDDSEFEKFLRVVFPVHAKVGCTKHLCGAGDRFFCAFSPKVEISDGKLVKKGRPGTECESGSKNKDGLCKPGPSEAKEVIESREHMAGGPEDYKKVGETKANFDSDSSPSNFISGGFSLFLSFLMILLGF